MVFFQNATVCLPPGLDCYKDEAMKIEDNCTLPCKGIYADVTVGGVEDLYKLMNFKPVLDRYKEYKAGFMKDQGKKLCLREAA